MKKLISSKLQRYLFCIWLIVVFYLFLSLCNWEINIGHWGFFSRLFLGVFSLMMVGFYYDQK